MNKKIIWLTAFALSMSVSQVTLACGNHHKAFITGERYEKMAEKLDLSADQKTKIKAIGMKARDEMKPKFHEMRVIHKKLNHLAKAKVLDHNKINHLISQQKDLVGAIALMKVTTRHDINMALTDAQKAKLASMVKKWEEKRVSKSCSKS